MSSSSNNTTSFSMSVAETDFSRQVKFISLLTLQIPSIACSLFVLYHLVFNRTNRQALHNHVMMALLMTGLITVLVDLSMVLNYLYTGMSTASTPIGCLIWNFIDLSLYALISLFMLWASIERHILVFHDRLVNTKQRRHRFHYAPLIILPIYVIIFYSIVIFIHPCKNVFDYRRVVCGELCYYSNTPLLGFMDQLLHNIIPSILTALLNMALLIRVRWQKHCHMRQPMRWQHQRKMVLQLIPASVLYLCGVIPFGLLACIRMLGGWSDVSIYLQLHFFYLFIT